MSKTVECENHALQCMDEALFLSTGNFPLIESFRAANASKAFACIQKTSANKPHLLPLRIKGTPLGARCGSASFF